MGITGTESPRVYSHQKWGGEILRADPKSLKAVYGSEHPEAYPSDDPRFLEEVSVDMGNMGRMPGFVVSPRSPGRATENYGHCLDGLVVVELQQQDGGYTEMGVDESRLWLKTTNERELKKQLLKQE